MGQENILTSDEARKIVSAIRASLATAGFKANVTVVNRYGFILDVSNREGTRPNTAHVAELKAKQSAQTGRRTRYLRDQVAAGETTPEIYDIDPKIFIKWAGGVPIYDADENLLGGVGISNLTEDQDEGFAIGALRELGYLSDKP